MYKNMIVPVILAAAVIFAVAGCDATSSSSGGGGGVAIVNNTPGETVSGIQAVAEPEANVANDGADEGIYKGTLAGSTGSFKVNLNNDGDGVYKVWIEFDGSTYEWDLTTSSPYSYSSGGNSFSITLDGSGNITDVSLTIGSHPDPIAVAGTKETSAAVVKVFKGTAVKAGSSTVTTWNMSKIGDDVWGAYSNTFDDWHEGTHYEYLTQAVFDGTVEAATGVIVPSSASLRRYARTYGTSDAYVEMVIAGYMPQTYPGALYTWNTTTHIWSGGVNDGGDLVDEIIILNETDTTMNGTWRMNYDSDGDGVNDSIDTGTWSGTRIM